MMKTSCLVASVVAISAFAARSAHADPNPRGYLAVGGEAGSGIGALTDGVSLAGGYHASARVPIYVRAQVGLGAFSDLSEAVGSQSAMGFYQGSGTYVQARAGAEYLQCTSGGGLCGVYGMDLGALRTSATTGPFIDTASSRYTQEQVIPRVGLELGGERLRVRTSAELSIGTTQRESMSGAGTTTTAGAQGFQLGLAVAYGF
jgi:hypothetical protein